MANPFAQYTEYVGLEIPVNMCIVSPFSRQMANRKAGPVSALESMGAEQTFPIFPI